MAPRSLQYVALTLRSLKDSDVGIEMRFAEIPVKSTLVKVASRRHISPCETPHTGAPTVLLLLHLSEKSHFYFINSSTFTSSDAGL